MCKGFPWIWGKSKIISNPAIETSFEIEQINETTKTKKTAFTKNVSYP